MTHDFIVVGSGGGGGTIAWMLGKAGFSVMLLEQGTDWSQGLIAEQRKYDSASHDEYRFRIERPEVKRRLRGDYNTFRSNSAYEAMPFNGGWTGSQLGGGTVLWGGWGFRALPIDFVLRTHFTATKQIDRLDKWGYAVADWPVSYSEMEPYYNIAEALFTVCGDRPGAVNSVVKSDWFKAFAGMPHFDGAGDWRPGYPYPQPPYPQVPSGDLVRQGWIARKGRPLSAPSSMIHPDVDVHGFDTRPVLERALRAWPGPRPDFWDRASDEIWSDRVRDACTMCGFCGEFLCWGRRGPKSGTRTTFIRELEDLPNVTVRFDAKVFEITYDTRLRRASGVSFLDLRNADRPVVDTIRGRHVIVSAGAVQSARLLLMSGPPEGLGNRRDQVGRHVTFHLFGLGASCVLPSAFQGVLRNELGHTGNTVSYDDYFLKDKAGEWWKGGIVVSAAKKNPLEGAITSFSTRALIQDKLIRAMEDYNRTVEIRITGDDLPMANNRVDLDPMHVDEHGLPVARVTRSFGYNEINLFKLVRPKLEEIFEPFADFGGGVTSAIHSSDARVDLISDHQFGTCRMGDDPAKSVVDRHCRLHDVPNVFVVDSSVFPTGLGVNPMMTVVANALRVGSWIVERARRGPELS
jgi:choline dehydrogenase-like flavoprotein